jgi:predicted Zn-dependent protease
VQFLIDPKRRWPWLAHAAIVAKHRLNDPKLALRYATALSQYATDPSVPSWVKQMRLPIYEDMGEYDAARILLGGLLDSGTVTDPHEYQFLAQRLSQLKDSAEKSSKPSKR